MDSRQYESDLRFVAALRAHSKGNIFLRIGGPEAGGIDAAVQTLRHGELEINIPASVVKIIVVKMYCTIFTLRMTPA